MATEKTPKAGTTTALNISKPVKAKWDAVQARVFPDVTAVRVVDRIMSAMTNAFDEVDPMDMPGMPAVEARLTEVVKSEFGSATKARSPRSKPRPETVSPTQGDIPV